MSVICNYCDKQYSTKPNLLAHLRNVHFINGGNIKCAICKLRVQSRKQLRNHMKSEHKFSCNIEKKTFNTESDFTSWKCTVEKQTTATFVQDSSVKTLKDGTKKQYLNCHRSHKQRNNPEKSQQDRKRRLKNKGSCKIDSTCPSSMEVMRLPDGRIKVLYYKEHCGHIQFLGHQRLTRDERSAIAAKRQQGVTKDRIISDIRNEALEIGTAYRYHLISTKDISNIDAEFNIDTHQLHKHDATSVDQLVKACSGKDDNPFLFYKPQNEIDPTGQLESNDFALVIMTPQQVKFCEQFGKNVVCIDGTHGTNAHDFDLTTILCVDDFGSGVPVAHMLCNRKSESAMRVFFNSVKSKMPIFQPQEFMTDDDITYYNAWVAVFGPPVKKLLCTWHVLQNWRKYAEREARVPNENKKRDLLLDSLRVLFEEPDVDKFLLMLDNFIEDCKTDPDTQKFGEYFEKHYKNRASTWALCYRRGCQVNTNMRLEAMHRKLKHIYLKGKVNRRVDTCINALLNMSRDSAFDMVIKIVMRVPTYKLMKIREAHDRSLRLPDSYVTAISPTEWRVQSESDKSKHYTVRVNDLHCKDCEFICTDCNTCMHAFECECNDYIVKINFCKHIHLCVRASSLQFESNLHEKESKAEEKSKDVLQIIDALPSSTEVQVSKTIRFKSKVETLLGVVNNVEDLDDDDYLKLERSLDKCLAILNHKKPRKNTTVQNNNIKNDSEISSATNASGSVVAFTSVANTVPANKNVEAQRGNFYSTKNKRSAKKSRLSLPKVTPAKALCASEVLGSQQRESLYVHSDFDHGYVKNK